MMASVGYSHMRRIFLLTALIGFACTLAAGCVAEGPPENRIVLPTEKATHTPVDEANPIAPEIETASFAMG